MNIAGLHWHLHDGGSMNETRIQELEAEHGATLDPNFVTDLGCPCEECDAVVESDVIASLKKTAEANLATEAEREWCRQNDIWHRQGRTPGAFTAFITAYKLGKAARS